MAKIIGKALANMPWQERPTGSDEIVWRHTANPIIGWNPIKNVARMFNSAVVPFEGNLQEYLEEIQKTEDLIYMLDFLKMQ